MGWGGAGRGVLGVAIEDRFIDGVGRGWVMRDGKDWVLRSRTAGGVGGREGGRAGYAGGCAGGRMGGGTHGCVGKRMGG